MNESTNKFSTEPLNDPVGNCPESAFDPGLALPLEQMMDEEEGDGLAAHNRRVFLSDDILCGYTGLLEGRVNPSSGVHYLWKPSGRMLFETQQARIAGSQEEAEALLNDHVLCGWWDGSVPRFVERTEEAFVFPAVERFSESSLYSRNGTLVAQDALARKNVVIAGVGSVGSQVALLLARAGVMRFLLVDDDCVEWHNLSRTFDLSLLGMYKTHAVRSMLQQINPDIEVRTLEVKCQNAGHEFYDQLTAGETLVIGCADNRVSDAWLCDLCESKHVDFLSCGFWDNAAVCENYVYRAGTSDHTYGCLLEESVIEDARIQHNNNYTSNDGVERKINAGLGINVQMGNAISAQLALDLLLRGEKNYNAQILPYLSTQMLFFVCTNHPDLAGKNAARWFPRPLWSQCCELHPSAGCRCAARSHNTSQEAPCAVS